MKTIIQSNFGDIPTNKELNNKINDIIDMIGYRYRIENISYDEAVRRVFDKLGFIKTKSGTGIAWTKKTKSTYFLSKKGKIVAIYNMTNKTFWWVKQ